MTARRWITWGMFAVLGAADGLYLVAGVACARVHIDQRGVKVTAWSLGRPKLAKSPPWPRRPDV